VIEDLVYFVLNNVQNLVKIGYVQKPENLPNRISALQSASANELNLLCIMEGDLEKEKWLHGKFLLYNYRNEWYLYSQEIKKFIAEENSKKVISKIKSEIVSWDAIEDKREMINRMRDKIDCKQWIHNRLAEGGRITTTRRHTKTEAALKQPTLFVIKEGD